MSFADRVRGAEDLGPLPWWAPTEKTPWVVGVVVEYRRVNTEYGEMTGAALKLQEQAVVQDSKGADPRLAAAGEIIIVWLKNTVLRNNWNAPQPIGGPPGIGELVGAKRVGERTNTRGQTYPVFQVMVDGRDGVPPKPITDLYEEVGDDPSFGDPGFSGGQEDDLPF